MFSGLCTILFLLIVQNKVPSYLGTSASFVASVAAIRVLDTNNDSSYVTGAILVGGLVLAAVGVLVHFAGADLIHRILPPAVTGGPRMLAKLCSTSAAPTSPPTGAKSACEERGSRNTTSCRVDAPALGPAP
jgi:hypothetical protein